MKILKITCDKDSMKCFDNIISKDSKVISVKHWNNNHLLFYKDDYDIHGHVKKENLSKSEKNKIDISLKKEFDQVYQKEFV